MITVLFCLLIINYTLESFLKIMNTDEKKEVQFSPSEEIRVVSQLENDKADIKVVDASHSTSGSDIDESRYLSLSQVVLIVDLQLQFSVALIKSTTGPGVLAIPYAISNVCHSLCISHLDGCCNDNGSLCRDCSNEYLVFISFN